MQLLNQGRGFSVSTGGTAIYRPGGVASGNVFTTLLAAVDAARTQGGPGSRVLIDGSLGSPVGAAVAYDVTNLQIVGLGGQTPVLAVPNGATFTTTDLNYGEIYFENVFLEWSGTSAAMITAPSTGMYVSLVNYAELRTTVSATKAIIAVANGGDLFVDIGYGCKLRGASSRPVINSGTALTELFFGVSSVMLADTITGGSDGGITVTDLTAGLTAGGGAATISHSQTGTTNIVYVP